MKHTIFDTMSADQIRATQPGKWGDYELPDTIQLFRRVVLIILSLIGLIVLLGRFDVDVSAFVTTLGVGSLAIALAAQATLADTINGFVIMMDRPFHIGDRIEIQELNTWGSVA